MPLTQLAPNQRLRGTGELSWCEVIPLCNNFGAESNSKNL